MYALLIAKSEIMIGQLFDNIQTIKENISG